MLFIIYLLLLQLSLLHAEVQTIYYKHQGNRVSKIYLPQEGPKNNTKIIFLHGGGLVWGGPETKRYDELCKKLGQLGYPTFSLDYELLWTGGSEEKNQKYFEDAINYFQSDAQSEIIIFGVSSGAWVGLKGIKNLKNKTKLKKFIGISPLVHFEGNFISEFLTSQYSMDCKKEDEINMPVHLIRGDQDNIIPKISLEKFCEHQTDPCTIETTNGGHEILDSFSASKLKKILD
jgi:pimeloyl-ACP methyl ester carboxylesterase